jgi:hypothetical protein
MFQSQVERFITPKPYRLENLSDDQYKKISSNAGLFGKHNQALVSQSSNFTPTQTLYSQAMKKHIPFNTFQQRPFQNRFNTFSPGPGEYK